MTVTERLARTPAADTRTVDLSDLSNELCLAARAVGSTAARRLFHARGNNIEVHLSEYELAVALATAAELALDRYVRRVAACRGVVIP